MLGYEWKWKLPVEYVWEIILVNVRMKIYLVCSLLLCHGNQKCGEFESRFLFLLNRYFSLMTWFHYMITFLCIICIWYIYESPFWTDHMESSTSALGTRSVWWLTMGTAICAADEQSCEIKGITQLFCCPYFVLCSVMLY